MGFRSRLYRLLYPVAITAVRVLGIRLRGVRVVVCSGNDVLLVRHTYGSRAWGIPGGRMDRGEDAVTAAVRETCEETGIGLRDAKVVPGSPFTMVLGLKGELWVVTGEAESRDFESDGAEIGEIRWFPADALPEGMLLEAIAALEAAGLQPPRREA